jgi:N-acetylmuramoyl-L-alanine amidase
MSKKVLYIDAGHGGVDAAGNYTTPPTKGKFFDHKTAGTFHKGGIFYEGVFNRSLANKFIEMATQVGFHCVPVYDPIADTSLGNRVETANKYFDEIAGKTGTYLSFHSNAFKSVNRGFNVFYHPYSERGKRIATKIVKPIQQVFIDNGSVSPQPLREGWMDAAKTQIFYVLEATKMPSILFEFGFFDQIDDAKMLFSDKFQCDLALKVIESLQTADLW